MLDQIADKEIKEFLEGAKHILTEKARQNNLICSDVIYPVTIPQENGESKTYYDQAVVHLTRPDPNPVIKQIEGKKMVELLYNNVSVTLFFEDLLNIHKKVIADYLNVRFDCALEALIDFEGED